MRAEFDVNVAHLADGLRRVGAASLMNTRNVDVGVAQKWVLGGRHHLLAPRA